MNLLDTSTCSRSHGWPQGRSASLRRPISGYRWRVPHRAEVVITSAASATARPSAPSRPCRAAPRPVHRVPGRAAARAEEFGLVRNGLITPRHATAPPTSGPWAALEPSQEALRPRPCPTGSSTGWQSWAPVHALTSFPTGHRARFGESLPGRPDARASRCVPAARRRPRPRPDPVRSTATSATAHSAAASRSGVLRPGPSPMRHPSRGDPRFGKPPARPSRAMCRWGTTLALGPNINPPWTGLQRRRLVAIQEARAAPTAPASANRPDRRAAARYAEVPPADRAGSTPPGPPPSVRSPRGSPTTSRPRRSTPKP
jgi:hypothetical protein